MLVKVNFGEDIRRFTLEHPFQSFSGLELQLSNLYKLSPQEFKIFYTDNEGDRVILSSNEELNAALSYASEQSNVLRLTIELAPQKKSEKIFASQPIKSPQILKPSVISTGTNTLPPANSSLATNTLPIITSSASTNTNSVQQSSASTSVEISTNSVGLNTIPEDKIGKVIDELDMDELLAHPKFQEKLSVIISHAISTQAFSQLLQSMLPQMKDILKESIKVTTSKGNEPNINAPLNKSELLSTTTTSSSSDFSNPPIVTLIPNIEGSVDIKASSSDIRLPTSSSSSSSNDQILFKKEKRDSISEFTVIPEETKKIEKDQKSSTPLIDSFLSLFKPNNNSNNNNSNSPVNKKQTADSSSNTQDENEEVNIPNLEELLSQLEAMGFHDKGQNIKTLRFHKKFNEGLDEVIEDLLGQQAKQEK